jgi:hypothetical protein
MPSRRVRPYGCAPFPAVGDQQVRVFTAPCPVGEWVSWRQPCEFSQTLADMAKGKRGVQTLNQAEDVAFGVAGRIPPAFAAVANDQDLALATTVLEAELRALFPVEFPWRRRALKHDCTMDLAA